MHYGIDLGTTNSAIAAVVGESVHVFKTTRHEDYLPSAVRIDARGGITVGRKAYEHALDDPDNTAIEFKRLMGQSTPKHFALARVAKLPEELSAEILKALKQLPLAEGYPEPVDVVIGVPAAFDLTQREATVKAAVLANMPNAVLVPEPIAAALAAGYARESRDEYWLVYDLGGGTFDVAVVSATEGRLQVVEHAGNNFLGGKDLDWKIVEEVFMPELRARFALPPTLRDDVSWRPMLARLKRLAEETKIELSATAEYFAEDHMLGMDQRGRPVTLEVLVSRKQLEELAAPWVAQTVALIHEALGRAHLAPSDIARVIPIGGPTLMPVVRRALQSLFNDRLDLSLNPITAVAEGAARYAAAAGIARPHPATPPRRQPAGIRVVLKHPSVTSETETTLGGIIEGAGASRVAQVKIERADGGWTSPLLPVQNRRFIARVPLARGMANEFRCQVFDSVGSPLLSVAATAVIQQGVIASAPPVAHSLSIEYNELFGRRAGIPQIRPVIKRGDPLPARGTDKFRTIRAVDPREPSTSIEIRVREGDLFPFASRNTLVGIIKITGSMVPKPLPPMSEVEITMELDLSSRLRVTVYIPYLDAQIDKVFSIKPDEITVDQLRGELEQLEKRLTSLRILQDEHNQTDLPVVEARLRELRQDVIAAAADDDARLRAVATIREVGANIDRIEGELEWPRLVEEWDQEREATDEVVRSLGNAAHRAEFMLVETDGSRAVREKSAPSLLKATAAIANLRWTILFSYDQFWLSAFERLATLPLSSYLNPQHAAELFEAGRDAIRNQDVPTLREIVWALWELLPDEGSVRFRNLAGLTLGQS
jgi:molecular chaperone DnaK